MAVYQAITFVYVFNYFQFRVRNGPHLGHHRRAFRAGPGLGRLRPRAVLSTAFPGGGWSTRRTPCRRSRRPGSSCSPPFGFWLFRGANEQKHRFKQDPNVKIWGRPAETLDGPSPGLGLLGQGPAPQLHRRDLRLLRVHPDDRVRFLGAVHGPGVANGAAAATARGATTAAAARSTASSGERYTKRVRYSVLPFVR